MPEEEKTRGGGPKTLEGKARSSQNSTKHGARAKHVLVLEDESEDDYTRHYNGWLNEFPPRNFVEEQLVEKLILNSWLMKRATRRAMKLEATAACEAVEWTAADEHKLELMQRYKTTAERAFYRSLAAVRQLGRDILKGDLTILKLTGELDNLRRDHAELEKLVGEKAAEEKVARAIISKANASSSKAHKKEKLAVIEQWVEIGRNEAGKTVTTLFPPNEDLKKTEAKKERTPDLVYRRLFFVGGVPGEYAWTTKNQQAVAYGGLGVQRMTWAKWQEQIVKEMMTAGGHLLPCGGNLPRPQERGGCECEVCTANQGMLRAAGLE